LKGEGGAGAKLFSSLFHLGQPDGSPGRSRDSSREEIMALKIKITIHYINELFEDCKARRANFRPRV